MSTGRYEDDGDNWDEYDNLDLFKPSDALDFNLYSKPGAQATLGQGESRSFKVTEDSVAIFARAVKSSYSVSVQRLLWVDGWEDSTRTKEMTLVVLKMNFTSLNPDARIGHMTATLRLRDGIRHGTSHPTPEAWAPFREQERYNASTAQIKSTQELNVNAKVGYSGTEASAGGKTGREISWNQVDFDEGHSAEVFRDNKPNGVLWFMKQNARQNYGVAPEIWAAVLLSRTSRDPYLVKFSLDVHAGTAEEMRNNTKKFLGLKPDETRPFYVTPWKKQVCNGEEGKAILASLGGDIDNLDNLGSLRDAKLRTKLNVSWGPKHQVSAPDVTGEEGQTAAALAAKTETGAGAVVKESLPPSPPTLPPNAAAPAHGTPLVGLNPALPQGFTLQTSLPPLVIGWGVPGAGLGVDYAARIAALEGRLADAEKRIAEQDKTLLQLRQKLVLKEATMDKTE